MIEGRIWTGLSEWPAARCQPGDIIVIAYGHMDLEEAKAFKPTVVFPDTVTNRLTA